MKASFVHSYSSCPMSGVVGGAENICIFNYLSIPVDDDKDFKVLIRSFSCVHSNDRNTIKHRILQGLH